MPGRWVLSSAQCRLAAGPCLEALEGAVGTPLRVWGGPLVPPLSLFRPRSLLTLAELTEKGVMGLGSLSSSRKF